MLVLITVSVDCSASRPNKSPVCGVDVAGQCEGNSGEDEAGKLCESDVTRGSISVRNMRCVRGDESFRENAHKEHCNVSLKKLEPHTQENFARVNACEASVLFTSPVAYKGIAHFLQAKLLAKNL